MSAGAVHPGTACNECGTSPIRGTRYVCEKCPEYDICASCYATPDHPHPFREVHAADRREAPPHAVAYGGGPAAAPVAARPADPQASLDAFMAARGIPAGCKQALGTPELAAVFPRHQFWVIHFRQFPVAMAPPEGFRGQASSVMTTSAAGDVVQISDVPSMTAFFKNADPAGTAAAMSALLHAWLIVAQANAQDGFYAFEVLNREFATDGRVVRGRSMVTAGGNGEVRATLTFDAAGKLAEARSEAALMPGPRPRCQSTKLLDSDPLVRYMAQEALRCMGLRAREYLGEQRALLAADDPLRAEMDRVWQDIEAAGW